jgi:hypothetical protein
MSAPLTSLTNNSSSYTNDKSDDRNLMHDPGDNLFVNSKRKRKRDTTVFTAQ